MSLFVCSILPFLKRWKGFWLKKLVIIGYYLMDLGSKQQPFCFYTLDVWVKVECYKCKTFFIFTKYISAFEKAFFSWDFEFEWSGYI